MKFVANSQRDQQHQQNMSITTYQAKKRRFGAFWGLYLVGINSIFDLKWLIVKLLVTTVMQFITTSFINRITVDKDLTEQIGYFVGAIYLSKMVNAVIEYVLTKAILNERLEISRKISTYIVELYKSTSYAWKSKNSNTAQKESIREIFYAYDNMTHTLSYALQSTVGSIVIFVVAFQNNWSIALVIIFGSAILYQIKKRLNSGLSEIDKKLGDTTNNINLAIANQFANRTDIQYTPKYETLFDDKAYNPVHGLVDSCQVWDDRRLVANKSSTVINVIRPLILMGLCAYLWYIEEVKMIVFVIINDYSLFGFLDVIAQLEQVKDISGSRITSSFKMIDEITDLEEVVVEKTSVPDIRDIKEIRIVNIDRPVTETISLRYYGEIILSLLPGITLLDGPKGCGKSMTLDFLAGFYDRLMTDGVYIDGIKLSNEFRDLQTVRLYLRQLLDEYKLNKKNTITMTLAELFPYATHDQVCEFIRPYGIKHKIPNDMATPVSLDERGLSPGETQAIILASQFWKAQKLQPAFMLLDEPERNIDFETVKNIFSSLPKTRIILSTHSEALKEYLKHSTDEVWKYEANEGGALTFKIHKKK